MKLYRLINSTLVQAFPEYWEENGTVYTNAAAEAKAVESGDWHPLTINPTPTLEEGQFLTKNYHLEDGTIVLDWIVNNPSATVDANLE